MINYKNHIESIPDFPLKGILYRDIQPLLENDSIFRNAIKEMGLMVSIPDYWVAVESRGFIFGSALAYEMNLPFVPIRKPGKLPFAIEEIEYELEYGSDTLQIHSDALKPQQKVVLVDDLIATGGTLQASRLLVEKMGAEVVGINSVIVLKEICPAEILRDEALFYLVDF